eukprot:403341716
MKIDPLPQISYPNSFNQVWALGESTSFNSDVSQGMAVVSTTRANEVLVLSKLSKEESGNYNIYQMINWLDVSTNPPTSLQSYFFRLSKPYIYDISSFRSIKVAIVPNAGSTNQGLMQIVGCGQTRYEFASEYYMQIFEIQVDIGTRQIDNQKFYKNPGDNTCLDSYVVDTSQFYVLFLNEATKDLMLIRAYNHQTLSSSSSIDQTTIKFGNLAEVNEGLIYKDSSSTFNALYVGMHLNSKVSSSFEQGIIINSKNSLTCSPDASNPIVQTLVWPFSSTSFSNNNTVFLSSRTDGFLFKLFSCAFSSLNPETANTKQSSYCSNQFTLQKLSLIGSYSISWIIQNGNFEFNVNSLYSGDQICTDKRRIHSITQTSFSTNSFNYIDGNLIKADNITLIPGLDTFQITTQFIDSQVSTMNLLIEIYDCAVNQVLQTQNGNKIYYINATSDIYPYILLLTVYCEVLDQSYTLNGTEPLIINYEVDSGQKTINLGDILTFTNNCGDSYTYQATLSNSTSLPAFIQYSNDIQFTVQTSQNEMIGVYEIIVTATIINMAPGQQLNTEFIWMLNVTQKAIEPSVINVQTNQYKPQFVDPINSLTIIAGIKIEYNLPLTSDKDGDTVTMDVQLNEAQSFAKFDEPKNMIEFNPDDNHAGFYIIKFTLNDNYEGNPFTNTYQLLLTVVKQPQNSQPNYQNETQLHLFMMKQEQIQHYQILYQQKLEKDIQERLTDAQQIESLGAPIQQSLQAGIYSSFVLQFVLQHALSLIWGAINTLQLITHLPLFKLEFPGNANYFLSFLIDLANMNILPDFEFLHQIPYLESGEEEDTSDQQQLGPQYQVLGYDSIYIFVILKNYIIFMSVGIALIILDKLISKPLNLKDQKIDSQSSFIKKKAIGFYKGFQAKIYYSWFFRFSIESYFAASVMSFHIVFYYYLYENTIQQINIFLTFVVIALLAFFPIFILYFSTNGKILSEQN